MTTVNLDHILSILMSPGDVQRLSLRLEQAIQAIAGRHQSFPWGVSKLDRTFRAGVLLIHKLDVVLPNGLHVARDDNRLRLDLRSLPAGEQIVYLTVSMLAPEEANRFMSFEPAMTADEVLGDDGIELPRARMRLALVTSPPASQDTSLPLLKVRNGGAGSDDWSEVPTFVPPLLKVQPRRSGHAADRSRNTCGAKPMRTGHAAPRCSRRSPPSKRARSSARSSRHSPASTRCSRDSRIRSRSTWSCAGSRPPCR
jgi:hypothetical protein